ncbi:hypothetical protein BC940DRAFT_352165 [Gongronella butleri]|nr:hypothetical protein BC940DRAFT_352165 [Gongronella butleri]
MDTLPPELLRIVLKRLWAHDMLEARLVNRAWSQIASEVASDSVMVDFSRLRPMVQHVNAGGTMQLVIKKLSVAFPSSLWRDHSAAEREAVMTEKFVLLNYLFPFLGHLSGLHLFVDAPASNGIPAHDSPFFDNRYFASLCQLVRSPQLRVMDLDVTAVELRMITPHLSTSLQEISIESVMDRSDLQLVVLFLRHLPLLRDLRIAFIASDRVDNQPLRSFIYGSLGNERQSVSMRELQLDFSFQQQQQQQQQQFDEPHNVVDLIYFLLFLMPNLDKLELYLGTGVENADDDDVEDEDEDEDDDEEIVAGSLMSLDHARLPGNVACPANLAISVGNSFAPFLKDGFTGPSIFQTGHVSRMLESLTLDGKCIALLPLLPLEHVHSLSIANQITPNKSPSLASPVTLHTPQLKSLHLNQLRVHFPLLSPPFPQINSLRINACKFPSPDTLELLLLQLPNLLNVHLYTISFDTWKAARFATPVSPWVDVLLFVFASSNRKHPSRQWLSLPIFANTVSITRRRDEIKEYVHIALQGGPRAKIWLTDLNANSPRALTDDDVDVLLQLLQNHKDHLLNAENLYPLSSSALVNTAFNRICVSQRVTVYACSSFSEFHLKYTPTYGF